MYNIICIFMNINENNRNERKTAEKIRDVHTKSHKKVLYNQTWYQIDATTWHFN